MAALLAAQTVAMTAVLMVASLGVLRAECLADETAARMEPSTVGKKVYP